MKFYLMFIGIFIFSLIISVLIGYLWCKLLSLIFPSPIFHISHKPKIYARTSGANANETFNLLVFLNCICEVLHCNIIGNLFRNIPFRVRKLKTKFDNSRQEEKYDSGYQDSNTNPKTFLHNGDIINEPSTKNKQNLSNIELLQLLLLTRLNLTPIFAEFIKGIENPYFGDVPRWYAFENFRDTILKELEETK